MADPVRFLPPPYTFIQNIDVSAGGWTAPANAIICELRCVADAADTDFTVRVRTTVQNADKDLKGRGENIWRLQLNNIRQVGTTANVQSGCIEVYGYFRDQIDNFIG